jgi:hypothetical protein
MGVANGDLKGVTGVEILSTPSDSTTFHRTGVDRRDVHRQRLSVSLYSGQELALVDDSLGLEDAKPRIRTEVFRIAGFLVD